MKKKLALLMAAIMTVAMVPMTAFAAASTDIVAVDQVKTAVDSGFKSRVEFEKDEKATDADGYVVTGKYNNRPVFEVELKLTNGKFTKAETVGDSFEPDYEDGDEYYVMDADETTKNPSGIVYGIHADAKTSGIWAVDVKNDTTAILIIDAITFNDNTCVLPIYATAQEAGDVVATFSTNNTVFADVKEVIAVASEDEVTIASEGVVTFVEDSTSIKNIKDITIDGLVNGSITDNVITLKLKGNWEFYTKGESKLYKADGTVALKEDIFTALNDVFDPARDIVIDKIDEDEIQFHFANGLNADQVAKVRIGGFAIKATKGCDAGDVATITVSSKDFDSVKLEVAKMVEEAVTYTVEDDDLPTIWAGKDYTGDDYNTLEVSVEENTGDILNTSRKATFTFPEGIEVVGVKIDGAPLVSGENLDIDENVVTIRNYQKKKVAESDTEKGKTDFDIKFILNAAPTFSGDVKVTLGGEFDDVELKVATVKAPYTVEAKTSEVLIDYRYVPVNEIVITEAEEGILEDDKEIKLQVEKMDFEDAGSYEVTSGDIEVKVNIDEVDKVNVLTVKVEDESTEASTITISGLELYLDRTLPVGGYALENIMADNILWENSSVDDKVYDKNGFFKYKEVTCNDSYVEVVTAGRDNDDSTTTRKIVITIGATTMAVGTETVTLDTPAYINAENYTELPLRAVSEAFGATVGWDDASRTVTVMMGQRIVSMTIGSKTMYINGTPVAMNTAPEITNERTFVPVRDLANALGITKIDWNEASATVTLN